MNRYEEIEIDGKRMLSVEVLNRIRRGENMLEIEQTNLDTMSAEELAAYLQHLRGHWKGNATGESPNEVMAAEPSEVGGVDSEPQAEWAKGVDFGESGQIMKAPDELSEAELQRITCMGIDIEDVDYICLTKHAFFVGTGGKRWQERQNTMEKPPTQAEKDRKASDELPF